MEEASGIIGITSVLGTCDERILMWDSEFPRNPQKYLESVNIHSVQTTALPSLPGVQEP